mgnify:CR=1 FL=1
MDIIIREKRKTPSPWAPLRIATTIVFALIQLAPGDPLTALVGDYPVPDQYAQEMRQSYGLDRSAPIGPIHPVAMTNHITRGRIELKVNGQSKQLADLSYMIWSVAEQISQLSQAFELKAGDIIYSGTPENVGPVVKGDLLLGHIDGLPELSVRIV